jgi:hypothetical protein
MSNRFLSSACAGDGSRALGSNRFLRRAGLTEELFAQVQSVELEVDASTTVTDPVFSTLLSVPITTSGGGLLFWFSMAGASSAAVTGEFRLLLDGAVLAGGSDAFIGATFAAAVAIALLQRNVAAGAHVVTVEWAKIPGAAPGTVLRCFPVTVPNRHHASLVVGELVD